MANFAYFAYSDLRELWDFNDTKCVILLYPMENCVLDAQTGASNNFSGLDKNVCESANSSLLCSNSDNLTQPQSTHSKEKFPISTASTSAHPVKKDKDREPDWNIYPDTNYTYEVSISASGKFGSRSVVEGCRRRLLDYNKNGTRRSVAAVFLVHRLGYPHILLLLHAETQKHCLMSFKYKMWEKPRDVLVEKLRRYILKPDANNKANKWVASRSGGGELEVGEYMGEWWRCEVDEELVPYVPPQVTRPKERMRIYQVQLFPRCSFRLPVGVSLTAVPLFDLHMRRYGLAICGVVHYVGRFKLRLLFPTVDKYEAAESPTLEDCEDSSNIDMHGKGDTSESQVGKVKQEI